MSQVNLRDEMAVNAPLAKVWQAIREPATHAEWHPFLTRIVGEHKLGAIRKCDVMMGNKSGHTEERCSVYDEKRAILWSIEKDSTGFSRMVSDWTAGFSLDSKDSNTTIVTAQSSFNPKGLLTRLMMPIIKRKFHQTQQTILSGLKQFVEKHP